MIRAVVATKKFTPRQTTQFINLGNGTIGLRNGLKIQHFRSFIGKIRNVENARPGSGKVVLQQSTYDDFDVSCHEFKFRKAKFYVNEIVGDQGKSVLVSSKHLPVCLKKIAASSAIAFGIITLTVVALLAASYYS